MKFDPITYKVRSGIVIQVVAKSNSPYYTVNVNKHSIGLKFETEEYASKFAEDFAGLLKKYV